LNLADLVRVLPDAFLAERSQKEKGSILIHIILIEELRGRHGFFLIELLIEALVQNSLLRRFWASLREHDTLREDVIFVLEERVHQVLLLGERLLRLHALLEGAAPHHHVLEVLAQDLVLNNSFLSLHLLELLPLLVALERNFLLPLLDPLPCQGTVLPLKVFLGEHILP